VVVEVRGPRKVRKPGEREAARYWETAAPPAGGRSGGPLLDRAGRVIGVASGAGDGRGYYAHAEEVHRFLRQNGLKWLFEEAR
jgi:S1-C subfamily serine protease